MLFPPWARPNRTAVHRGRLGSGEPWFPPYQKGGSSVWRQTRFSPARRSAEASFVLAAVRDEPVGVTVLDGVGEVAHDVAQRNDGFGGAVVRQSSGSKESVGGRSATGGVRRWHCLFVGVNGAGLGDRGGQQQGVSGRLPGQSARGFEQRLKDGRHDGGSSELGGAGGGRVTADHRTQRHRLRSGVCDLPVADGLSNVPIPRCASRSAFNIPHPSAPIED